jgi:eukaryotic-like serine/threonine-protein kinase
MPRTRTIVMRALTGCENRGVESLPRMLPPGDRLGPYEIVALIGTGGMGAVYQARDSRLDRNVAIKVADERFRDRSSLEAKAIAALNHPTI